MQHGKAILGVKYLLITTLLIVLFSSFADPAPVSAFDCDNPIRIMPLGDSITQGKSSGVDIESQQIGYRKTLYDMLAADGYDNINFVGSLTHGQDYPGFDPNHEGHPGRTDGYIASNVYGYLDAVYEVDGPVDIVLLHIGTNEVNTSSGDVMNILNEIDDWEVDNNSPIIVILARIINRSSFDQTTADFNTNVAAAAQLRINNGDDIIIVDMENGAGINYALTTSGGDMWDNLHPFATGYDKMAQIWFNALKTRLPSCAPDVEITSSAVTTAMVGEPYTYDVEALGLPAPTYSLLTAPAGMTIDSNSGVISWTPTTAGDFPVEVEASNGVTSDTESYTLRVNAPAQITSTAITTGTLDASYTYDVEASGYPAPTYSLTQSPGGMTIDSTTGVISWTPAAVGNFPVIVRAENSHSFDTQSFSINVTDTDSTPPVITLVGTSPVTVEVGTTYTDAGATAADDVDGNLTASIIATSNVDTTALGSYTVTYNVSDSTGNAAAPVTRTVNVVDTTPPVITRIGSATVSVEIGGTYTDAGASASDNYDGNLSGAIVTTGAVNTSQFGAYTITYNVSDSSGNAAIPVTRTVNVVDTTPPVITLVGSPIVIVEVGEPYTDSGATAADNYDGDLTAAVEATGSVNTNLAGTYEITYTVNDSSNNAAQPVTRTVHVFEEMHASPLPTVDGVYVDLIWTPVDGAERYRVVLVDEQMNILFDTWLEAVEICSEGTCNFAPSSDLLPYGLINGAHNWYVQAWGNGNYSSWRNGNFIVDAAPPQPQVLTVSPNQGRPTLTWADDMNALYFHIYIGEQDGSIVYLEWHKKTAELCNGTTCTLKPDINPLAGDYLVFIQPWGPGGFVPNDLYGWIGPANFTLSSTPPQAVTGLTVTGDGSGHFTFIWSGSPGATWYQIWAGTIDPLETFHLGWYLAEDIGCENAETCTITPDEIVPPGNYKWYVQAWGPGGLSTGGVAEGWAEGPEFSR